MKIETATKKLMNEFINASDHYQSENVTHALADIMQCELDESSYTYSYYNDELLLPAIVEICFYHLLKNIFDNRVVDPQKLSRKTMLVYAVPTKAVSQSVIFLGPADDKYENWRIQYTNSSGPNKGLEMTLSTATFKERISLGGSTSTRAKTDYREIVTTFLGTSLPSRMSNNKVLILSEKSIIDSVGNIQVALNGNQSYFGQIIPSRYMTSNGNFK